MYPRLIKGVGNWNLVPKSGITLYSTLSEKKGEKERENGKGATY